MEKIRNKANFSEKRRDDFRSELASKIARAIGKGRETDNRDSRSKPTQADCANPAVQGYLSPGHHCGGPRKQASQSRSNKFHLR